MRYRPLLAAVAVCLSLLALDSALRDHGYSTTLLFPSLHVPSALREGASAKGEYFKAITAEQAIASRLNSERAEATILRRLHREKAERQAVLQEDPDVLRSLSVVGLGVGSNQQPHRGSTGTTTSSFSSRQQTRLIRTVNRSPKFGQSTQPLLGSLLDTAEHQERRDEGLLVSDVVKGGTQAAVDKDRRRVIGDQRLVKSLSTAASLDATWVPDDDDEEEGVRGGWVEPAEEEEVEPNATAFIDATPTPPRAPIEPVKQEQPKALPAPEPAPVTAAPAPALPPFEYPHFEHREPPAVEPRDPLTGEAHRVRRERWLPPSKPWGATWPEDPQDVQYTHPDNLVPEQPVTEEDEFAKVFGIDDGGSSKGDHVLSDSVEDGDDKITHLGVETRANPLLDGNTLTGRGDRTLPEKWGVAVDRIPGFGEGYHLPLPGFDGASAPLPPRYGHRQLSHGGKVLRDGGGINVAVPNALFYGHRGYRQKRDTPKYEDEEAVDGQEDVFKPAKISLQHQPLAAFLRPEEFGKGSGRLEGKGINVVTPWAQIPQRVWESVAPGKAEAETKGEAEEG